MQGFHSDVALEVLQNLQDGHTTMKGKAIAASKVVIAEISGLSREGIKWTKKHVQL